MPTASATDVIATIVFWALMLPIAGYVFQNVCNMCGADPPTFRRSVLITVLVTAAAFFAFDGIGYGIVLGSRDTVNLNLPPGYQLLELAAQAARPEVASPGTDSLIRWLPVLVAVCLAATLYVFILTEPFRNCMAILAIQWTLNVVAMAIVSFSLSNDHASSWSGTGARPRRARSATRFLPVHPNSERRRAQASRAGEILDARNWKKTKEKKARRPAPICKAP